LAGKARSQSVLTSASIEKIDIFKSNIGEESLPLYVPIYTKKGGGKRGKKGEATIDDLVGPLGASRGLWTKTEKVFASLFKESLRRRGYIKASKALSKQTKRKGELCPGIKEITGWQGAGSRSARDDERTGVNYRGDVEGKEKKKETRSRWLFHPGGLWISQGFTRRTRGSQEKVVPKGHIAKLTKEGKASSSRKRGTWTVRVNGSR